MAYYLALTADQLATPALSSLTPVENALLSAIVHTFRLGVLLAEHKLTVDLAAPTAEGSGVAVQAARSTIDMGAPGAAECNKYILSALKSDAAADKLFPLRLTGPAMRFITTRLPLGPPPRSPVVVFQLCIWRTFAFGNLAHMESLALDLDENPPVLGRIEAVVARWGGPARFGIPAYGQLQISKKHVSGMLERLWVFAQRLSRTLATPGASLTFGKLIGMLTGGDEGAIHAIPHHGLISWVLTGDFAEYGLCRPATADDLAEHIVNTHAHGAKSALAIVAHRAGVAASAASDNIGAELSRIFQHVLHVLQAPPTDAIRQVAGDCERLQGRAITAVDLEHAFCKIARMESRATAGRSRAGAVTAGLAQGKGKGKGRQKSKNNNKNKRTKDTELSPSIDSSDEDSELLGASGPRKRKPRRHLHTGNEKRLSVARGEQSTS